MLNATLLMVIGLLLIFNGYQLHVHAQWVQRTIIDPPLRYLPLPAERRIPLPPPPRAVPAAAPFSLVVPKGAGWGTRMDLAATRELGKAPTYPILNVGGAR